MTCPIVFWIGYGCGCAAILCVLDLVFGAYKREGMPSAKFIAISGLVFTGLAVVFTMLGR